MDAVKNIVERSDSPTGRAFDLVIQSLIVVSLISFSLETIPDLTDGQQAALRWIEIVTVVVFTVEYCLRLVVSDNKLRYAFSFYGIVDLLAILPFYISTGIDLRSVRAFRLLRLFRTLKMARYSTAIRRFHRALLIAKEEIILFLCVSGIWLPLAFTISKTRLSRISFLRSSKASGGRYAL